MPSLPREPRRPRALLFVLLLAAVPALAAPPPAAPAASAVAAAAASLREDPLLFRSEKSRQLRLRGSDEKPVRADPDSPGGLADWLRNLLRWIDESGRVLVWLAGLALAAVLVVRFRLWRWLLAPAAREAAEAAAPTHVRDLDIRPDSLPPDIGAAAAARWAAGDARGTLVLLYRGALSRLVHGHGVPLRDASTEGECLALARPRLDADTHRWLAELVAAWQQLSYGGRVPAAALVLRLCAEFGRRLPAPPETPDTTLSGARA